MLVWVEHLLGVALLVITAVFMTPIIRGMTASSLSIDERGTITRYSGQGALRAITRYDLPKNHIFFNFLNAITPGSKSTDSLRARLWSFVATAVSAIVVLVYFARRGWFLEGALWVYLWGLNPQLLTLNLSARGYGFLSMIAICTAVLLVRYRETPKRSLLVILGVLTALGIWTVPSYSLFGGSVLLLFFLATRDRDVLIGGIGTALLTLLFYAPVLRQVWRVMHVYSGKYGEEFASLQAVASALHLYFLPLGDNWLFVIFVALIVAPFALWASEEPRGSALRVLVGAVVIFLAACLTMKTPPLRTTAFVMPVLMFCAVHSVGVLLRRRQAVWVRQILAVGITIPLLVSGIHRAHGFHFLASENWMGSAQAIKTIFSPETTICGSSNTLDIYLGKGYEDAKQFDREGFLRGTSLVLNSHMGNRKSGAKFAPGDFGARLVEIRIPQQQAGFQSIYFLPPADTRIAGMNPPLVTGSDSPLQLPATIALQLQPGASLHSLNLWFGKTPGLDRLKAELAVDGKLSVMEPFEAKGGDRIFSIRLPEKVPTSVEVRLSSVQASAPVVVRGIWANPARSGN